MRTLRNPNDRILSCESFQRKDKHTKVTLTIRLLPCEQNCEHSEILTIGFCHVNLFKEKMNTQKSHPTIRLLPCEQNCEHSEILTIGFLSCESFQRKDEHAKVTSNDKTFAVWISLFRDCLVLLILFVERLLLRVDGRSQGMLL